MFFGVREGNYSIQQEHYYIASTLNKRGWGGHTPTIAGLKGFSIPSTTSVDWLNSHIISWSRRFSLWLHNKCSGAQRKTVQINIVHTTTTNTLKLNTIHTRISIRLQHHVHSCPFPILLKITTEISRYIQRNTHNRGNNQQSVMHETAASKEQRKQQKKSTTHYSTITMSFLIHLQQ